MFLMCLHKREGLTTRQLATALLKPLVQTLKAWPTTHLLQRVTGLQKLGAATISTRFLPLRQKRNCIWSGAESREHQQPILVLSVFAKLCSTTDRRLSAVVDLRHQDKNAPEVSMRVAAAISQNAGMRLLRRSTGTNDESGRQTENCRAECTSLKTNRSCCGAVLSVLVLC